MGNDLLIRAATESDAAAVARLMAQLGYEISVAEISNRLACVSVGQDHWTHIVTCEARSVGFIHYFLRPAIEKPAAVVVQSLVVDAAVRHNNIGRLLVGLAEKQAVASGVCQVVLSSGAARIGAHKFYEALGFQRAGVSVGMIKRVERKR